MKKLIILTPILILFIATYAHAESEVNVKINNEINSSSTNEEESTTKTNVRIETDGKVMEYESEKAGNVNIKSINGETEIIEDGREISPNPTKKLDKQPSPKPTANLEQIEEKTNQIEKIMQSIKEQINSLQEKLLSFFG